MEDLFCFLPQIENNPVFLKAATVEDVDAERVLKMIEKELTSIKFSCFGKVKLTSKDKSAKKLEALQQEKLNKIKGNNPVNKEKDINDLDEVIASTLKQIETEPDQRPTAVPSFQLYHSVNQ